MASEMLEKVLAAEKQGESSVADARLRAIEIINRAHNQAAEAIENCKTLCSKNSDHAAALTAEKCREFDTRENTAAAAAERELLAKASGKRAEASHTVRDMILNLR